MSKFDLKPKATRLRKQGKSINEIARILNISKATASLWCSSMILSKSQKEFIEDRMRQISKIGVLKGAETNRNKKIESKKKAYKIAEEMLNNFSKRDRLITGVSLYWAEGSKADSTTGFIFVNSDPMMIKYIYNWLINIMNISKSDIVAKISINEVHKDRIEKVLNFWSNLLDLPLSQFLDTFFQKAIQKKVYENHDVHYGVLRLSVRRSTFLKYKVLALIEILKADVAQVARASHS